MLGSAQSERDSLQTHVAILLVGSVDRRILPAVRFVANLPSTDVRALHVATDTASSTRLALDWLAIGLSWVPLEIYDSDGELLEVAVQSAVHREAGRSGGVTAVIPELHFPKWWHPVLHRGAGAKDRTRTPSPAGRDAGARAVCADVYVGGSIDRDAASAVPQL